MGDTAGQDQGREGECSVSNPITDNLDNEPEPTEADLFGLLEVCRAAGVAHRATEVLQIHRLFVSRIDEFIRSADARASLMKLARLTLAAMLLQIIDDAKGEEPDNRKNRGPGSGIHSRDLFDQNGANQT